MKKIFFILMINLFYLLHLDTASAIERLFYLKNDILHESLLSKDKLNNILVHAKAIDILAPQIYSFDSDGGILGELDPALLRLTKQYNIKLLPLITNSGFDENIVHQFLMNPVAEKRTIDDMIRLCQQYHFYGMQFDIENINFKDKDVLTQFVKLAAQALHQNGYSLSIAVVAPLNNGKFHNTLYQKWYGENWIEAYDFHALAQVTDFISLMAYDLHTSLTGPGPIAPIDWVENAIKALLAENVPANKISLGIPLYSGYWTTAPNPHPNAQPLFYPQELTIDYPTLLRLLAKINKALFWDNQTQSSYLIWSRQGLYEYIFAENSQSFQAKLNLLNRYHLRGFSAWRLGMEDPNLWNIFKISRLDNTDSIKIKSLPRDKINEY